MSVTKILLADVRVRECGHRLQCWSEVAPDGTWELHFSAPCAVCQAIANEVAKRAFPSATPKLMD
jgi:hypothetical protein